MQHDLIVVIAEIHVVEHHVAGQFRVGDGAVRLMGVLPGPHAGALPALYDITIGIFLRADKRYIPFVHFRRFIHQLKNTVGAGKGHDNRVELLADLGDGLVEVSVERQEGNQCTDGQAKLPVCSKECAGDGADHIADMTELGVQRHQNISELVGIVGALTKIFVELSETCKAFFLMAEYLDHFLAFHHLLDITVDFPDILLLRHEVSSGKGGYVAGDKHHHAYHEKRDNGQRNAQIEHADKHADNGDHAGRKLREADTDQLSESIHVVGVDRHDITVGVCVKIFDGQRLHFCE